MNPGQEQPVVQLSSTYPLAPMDYVNMYTNENIKMGKAPMPPPIIKDTYTCFGKPIDPNDVLIRSLDQQGIQRLYTASSEIIPTQPSLLPHVNINSHKKELKKLNHSILIAYLDLLEILVKSPNTQLPLDQQQIDLNNQQYTFKTLRDQKLEDMELLFINMHHLVNELRPHQARDNIRCILETQKRQRLETAAKFKKHLFKIVDLLKVCITSIQSSNVALADSNSNNSKTDNTNNIKSSIFLDELNILISNATNLTKSLDTIDKPKTMNTKKIAELKPSEDNDIEMECGGVGSSSSHSDDNNNNNTMEDAESTKVTTSRRRLQKENAHIENNCDFKDVILCNLIDEFLLNENEF